MKISSLSNLSFQGKFGKGIIIKKANLSPAIEENLGRKVLCPENPEDIIECSGWKHKDVPDIIFRFKEGQEKIREKIIKFCEEIKLPFTKE